MKKVFFHLGRTGAAKSFLQKRMTNRKIKQCRFGKVFWSQHVRPDRSNVLGTSSVSGQSLVEVVIIQVILVKQSVQSCICIAVLSCK